MNGRAGAPDGRAPELAIMFGQARPRPAAAVRSMGPGTRRLF